MKAPRTQHHGSATSYHGGKGWASVTSATIGWERTPWECAVHLALEAKA